MTNGVEQSLRQSKTRAVRGALITALAGLMFTMISPMVPAADNPSLLPVPAEMRAGDGRFLLKTDFKVALKGDVHPRLQRAVERALRRIEERSGLLLKRTRSGDYEMAGDAQTASLLVECGKRSAEIPQLRENESYELSVTEQQIQLRAPTTLGVLRGLETLLQLLDSTSEGWHLPALTVKDAPRFPWRGLMLDVARHWLPIEVVKRNLEGMAVVKLNVLHLHLTEDQGFRIESRTHPRLHEHGSDGQYYRQEEIREIIAFAAERGIRVVPEFDMPGHATSWVVGYPELASAPGPYVIERRWGVFDPTLDPTNEQVYALLTDFLGEMAALFPDPYMHIGGDENNGVQWSANPRIQNFIRERGLKDNHGLQAYFNERVQKILEKSGKRLVGWDEILHPALSKHAVIQSWRGAQGLIDAARAGHDVILSNGYYIDLIEPAAKHYANDPLPDGTPLSDTEKARILGGEATMWAEWVNPETVDSRIWPRTAAIAERLWSPGRVKDLDDMYRRLEWIRWHLTTRGLLHDTMLEPMISRYAGPAATPGDRAVLHELALWVEPVKGYRRNAAQNDLGPSQFIPLTGLVDIARPDSAPSRGFARVVDAIVIDNKPLSEVSHWIQQWRTLAAKLKDLSRSGRLRARGPELASLAGQLETCAAIAEELVDGKVPGEPGTTRNSLLTQLNGLGGKTPVLEFPVVDSLKLLVVAVCDEAQRRTLSAEQWKQHVHAMAFPPDRN